jgi:hypothetical protein
MSKSRMNEIWNNVSPFCWEFYILNQMQKNRSWTAHLYVISQSKLVLYWGKCNQIILTLHEVCRDFYKISKMERIDSHHCALLHNRIAAVQIQKELALQGSPFMEVNLLGNIKISPSFHLQGPIGPSCLSALQHIPKGNTWMLTLTNNQNQ